MAYVRITEGDALTETLRILERLGGLSIVKAVRINTPENMIPRLHSDPEMWPVVLEVQPTEHSLKHVSRVCILNMNSGYRGRGPWATKELLSALGFDTPDVYETRFTCARFLKSDGNLEVKKKDSAPPGFTS